MVADVGAYEVNMKKASKATGQVADQANRSGTAVERSAKSFSDLQSRVLGVAAAGGAAVAGIMKLANAASRLEQSVGATESVFQGASDQVSAFAEDSVDAVGLSERAYRELAAVAGAQLKSLGFSIDDAAETSNQLITIGADLAATFGGTTEEAVSALGAAFRGEADPAERFGLRLNQTAVNAKAVELGLAKTESQVSANAKAQATLALVMEQSADSMGQFAREADSAAGAQQRANAQWEDAQATLGEKLLPVVTDVTESLGLLAKGVSDPSWAGFGAILEQSLVNQVRAMSLGFIDAESTLDKLRGATDAEKMAAIEAAGAADEWTVVNGEAVRVNKENAAQARLSADALNRQTEETKELQEAQDDYVDSLRAQIDPFFAVLEAEEKLATANQRYTEALAANTDEIEDNNVSAEEMAAIDRDVASAALGVEAAVSEMAIAVRNNDITVEAAKQTLRRLYEQGLINEGQFIRMTSQVDSLSGRHVQITTAADTYAASLALDQLISKMRVVTAGGTFVITGGSAIAREQKAEGGLSDAVMMPPGPSLFEWREPETMGEAFIPLAAGKRRRSTAILAEVANRFGYQLLSNAQGGITNWVDLPFRVDKNWSDFLPFAPALSAGIGWKAMWDALRGVFPKAALYSAFRPGAITATGNPSYHGKGRAIDVTPSMDIFNWIAKNYPGSREVIYSPAGGNQIRNGGRHMYGEPTRGDHWDHVHWAMARGGILGGGTQQRVSETINVVVDGAVLARTQRQYDRFNSGR
jgi:hypothetical protein